MCLEIGWIVVGRIFCDLIWMVNFEYGIDGCGVVCGVCRDVYVWVLLNRRRKSREARG